MLVFLLMLLPLAASAQLKIAVDEAQKRKLSMMTRMFITELNDGGFDPVKQEIKRRTRASSGNILNELRPHRRSKNEGRLYAAPDTINGRAFVSAFITLKDNSNVSALEALGVKVQCKFENGIITSEIPVDQLATVAALSNVTRISVARILEPYTDLARKRTNVDDILTQSDAALSAGLNTKYDGTGVLLGIIDAGIDFQHIAFKDKDGNSRIVGGFTYDGKDVSYYDSSNISTATTDNSEIDHGTHTASIAGGSSVIIDGDNVTVTDDHSKATYGGMAPGASLFLLGVHDVSDVDMSTCINYICTYADNQGMPVVINNSWGNMSGNHQGIGKDELRDICSQYFKDNPNHICLFSSGNHAGNSADDEGGGVYVHGTASEKSPLRTIIRQKVYSNDDAGYVYSGMLAYACLRNTCTELLCRLYILNNQTGEILTSIPLTESGYVTGLSDYYSGQLYFEIDNELGAAYLSTPGDDELKTKKYKGSSYKTSEYTLAFEIYPKSGSEEIDIWGWKNYFTNHLNTEGIIWTAGSDDMSVNNQATYPDVISVGAYVSGVGGTDYKDNPHPLTDIYQSGDIAPFSGYATEAESPSGVYYPWITAPGTAVISAVNHYHTSGYYLGNETHNEYYRVNSNKTYPYGTMSGTSMACPVTAGIVALWLQAAKEVGMSLTTSDVKRIMAETAIKDSYVTGTNSSHFGNGKIDALAGIAKILEEGQKPRIEATPTELVFEGIMKQKLSQTVNVKGWYLSGNITATLNDDSGIYSINKSSFEANTEGTDIIVTWAPTEAGKTTATLTLSADGIESVVVTLTGNADALPPVVSTNTKRIVITSRIGSTSSQVLTVLGNYLTDDISLSVSDGDGAFSVSPKTISMSESGKPVKVKVSFSPSSAGTYSGMLSIRTNGVEAVSIILSGTGTNGSTTLSSYEYWFDDDVDSKKAVSISGYEAEINTGISTQHLSDGVHKFCLRFKQSDGMYSSVSTSTFMNLKSEKNACIVYWFDDDVDNTGRTVIADTEEEQEVALDLQDMDKFPYGFHLLNMRVATPGKSLGSVYTTRVMKMASGNPDKMEYWVDGDFAHRKRVTGSVASYDDNYYVYTNPFDLSGVPAGLHRIYYRAASSTGVSNSAVSMTPVMVNSMYEQNYQDARILGYSISVDDQEPQIREFGTPKEEIVMSHTLDARNLSSGSHKVKAKFWNSAYAGVSVDQQFKVVIPEPPTLQLTAQEKDGLVSLQFESVPNDLRYRIVRVDANGAKARVDGREGSSYPGLVEFVDNPTAGTYTYYVQTAYTDFKGEQQSLKSNEVSVTIAEKPEEVAKKYGNITGSIACDKNMPSYGLKVLFSDGVSVNVVGTLFMRTKIPEGTELTMTVEGDDTHEYEPATLTVKAGANVIALKGTLKEEYMPNNLANDLAICSALEQSVADGKDHHLKFTVKNLSGYNKWTGYLRVKAIDRKWADKKDIDIATTTYEKKNFYIGETERIELSPSGNREVDVCIKKLNLKEETEFYLYLESVGKWLDSDDSEETKPLAIAVGADIANNPVVKTIEKTEQAGQNWDGEASERFAYLMLGLSSLIQGIDGNVGDLSDCYDAALDAAKSVTGKYTASEAISAVFEWLDGKTVLEAAYEPSFFNLSTTIYGIYRFTKSTVKPSYVQKYWTDILGASYDYASAQLVLHDLVVVGKAIKTKDPIEASLLSAELLYSLMYSGTAAPYASMMYAYMVVGKAMVSKLLEFASIMRGRYIVTRLKANKPYDGDEENRQNTAVDFKIVVKTKNLIGSSTINFQKADASSQIKSVSIKAAHKKGDVPAEFSYTPVFMKDCVMLKSDGRGITNSRSLDDQNEIKELYMEINWSNGRQTLIPLNDETDGIDISFIGADPQGIDDFEKMKPLVYTVTLTTATGKDNMADELYLGTNKNRK